MKWKISTLLAVLVAIISFAMPSYAWTCSLGHVCDNSDFYCLMCGERVSTYWVCPKCGKEATTAFCPYDLETAPWVTPEGTMLWVCPVCQSTLDTPFCGNDRERAPWNTPVPTDTPIPTPTVKPTFSPTPKPTSRPTPKPTPKPTPTPYIRVGDHVSFGSYPQTRSGRDASPIEWEVLDKSEKSAMLISLYALDSGKYNEKYLYQTYWENSSMRNWLNSSFYNMAFSYAEQQHIQYTNVNNAPQQGNWNTVGGANTVDKVFLLSYAEVKYFFPKELDRICYPTEYAKGHGVYYHEASGRNFTHWWLRSPGKSTINGCYITDIGGLRSTVVNDNGLGIRPVIWVDLEAIE